MTVRAILNPAAGGGAAGRRMSKVEPELRSLFPDLEIVRTEGPAHATALAREGWEAGVRTFLVIGGDGTAYEVLNGLFPITDAERPRLGYLPLGTGNSFVRDFGVTCARDALKALHAHQHRLVDVVRLEHDEGELHFVNLCSLGFSAAAGELTNRRFKALGAAGYIAAVLVTLARLEHPIFPVQLDGGAWDRRPAALLSFSNSGYTAGTMNMAPGADPCDGEIDVIRVGALSRPRFLATFPRIFAGTHTQAPDIEQARATEIVLDLDGPVDCMIDGEIVRIRPQRLSVLPHALEVLL
ncbi:MAG: diacylglycerol kinase family lipid kinase [Deltaproteobacteria bacterium]|nr:MAG: diacylglycerol kinase family lipid kinase [Deltaproteobacteria bacterium]